MNFDVDTLNGRRVAFSKLLDITFTAVDADRLEAEMLVRPDLLTRPDVLHGGAVMSFADTVGAVATVINLPVGATTTTLESKTNFVAGIPVGEKAYAVAEPIHKGRSTMVWQTRITREDGRLAAVVTQTQMVLGPR